MRLAFDDAVAGRLVVVLRAADDALRGQGARRRGAVETAVVDFAGRYARVFTDACVIEAQDRGRLARVLGELADQVMVAQRRAREERERRTKLAAWEEREAERRRRALADPTGGLAVVGDRFADPRPSAAAVPAPHVRAVFVAARRPRSAGGSASGRTSADPGRLRSFARQARASDAGMRDQLARVAAAWAAFAGSCGWVVVESATFLAGFGRYLEENGQDAAWVERVAAAFQAAGGGALPDRALHALRPDPHPLTAGQLDGTLKALQAATATEAAQLWGDLTADARAGLIRLNPAVIGNLEGIPYADRDTANVSRLTALVYEAKQDLKADPDNGQLKERLRALQFLVQTFAGGKALTMNPPKYLITLDASVLGPPLAAISVGNLDSATNATFFIPGMNIGLPQAEDYLRLTENLQQKNPDHAVVLFLNYPAPGPVGVLGDRHAVAGAERLAAMLDGYNAARFWSGLTSRLNVVAHSYGTTLTALALSLRDFHVDSLALVASAGLTGFPGGISRLHVDPNHVFATQARTDQLATTGRLLSGRRNPDSFLSGARHFGSDGTVLPDGTELDGVKGHDPIGSDPAHDSHKYFGPRTESLRNLNAIINGDYGKVTGNAPAPQPGPSPSPPPSTGARR